MGITAYSIIFIISDVVRIRLPLHINTVTDLFENLPPWLLSRASTAGLHTPVGLWGAKDASKPSSLVNHNKANVSEEHHIHMFLFKACDNFSFSDYWGLCAVSPDYYMACDTVFALGVTTVEQLSIINEQIITNKIRCANY